MNNQKCTHNFPIPCEECGHFYPDYRGDRPACHNESDEGHTLSTAAGVYKRSGHRRLEEAAVTMFVEVKVFENGRAEARLSKECPEPPEDAGQDEYEYHIEKVDDLKKWINGSLKTDNHEFVSIAHAMESGGWVDIADNI